MEPNKVYQALRDKIIQLDLPPESVLNLSELAETFNVSRTPIKEALIHLQAEGWVMRQGTHFIVTPLSLDRIREITEIRMVMEVQANIWAMQRITPAETAALGMIKEQIKALNPGTGNRTIVELDFKCHRHLFKAAKNDQMRNLLERILRHYLRFWLSIPRQIDLNQFFTETLDLFQAIENKDEAAVREHTRKHIRNSIAEIMGT